MLVMDIDPILPKIKKFLARHPTMTPTGFGIEAVNDSALMTELCEGRELRRKTRARIEDFMASYKNGSK